MIDRGDAPRKRLYANAERFRSGMTNFGFTLAGVNHPIIPVMLGDATVAQNGRKMLTGCLRDRFCFPVVPKGQALIRTQMSSVVHAPADIDGRYRRREVRGGRRDLGLQAEIYSIP